MPLPVEQLSLLPQRLPLNKATNDDHDDDDDVKKTMIAAMMTMKILYSFIPSLTLYFICKRQRLFELKPRTIYHKLLYGVYLYVQNNCGSLFYLFLFT